MTALSTPDALAALLGPYAGSAWSVLVERHGQEVWRLIASRVRDIHEAEDAYQEFWVALPKATERFQASGPDSERSARAWLMRIAYITAVDRLRRRGSSRLVSMQALDRNEGGMDDHDDHIRRQGAIPAIAIDMAGPGGGTEDDQADRTHLVGKVQEAMSILPETYRRPLLLHVVGGLSYDELAMDLRCTVNHARVKVHRGLKRLREILGVEGASLSDQMLSGLLVPMIPTMPIPTPPMFSAAKAISKKLVVKKSAALGKTGSWIPGAIAAGCLAVVTAVAVTATSFHRPPANGTPQPSITTIPRTDATVERTIPERPLPMPHACPLDGLPASSAAFGLRRLHSAYQGPAVRVRAGNSLVERDIGFIAGDSLDTTALRAFCPDSDGFVVVWYDQSGNGIDMVQRTIANQPQVVQRGSLLDIGGRAAVRFARAHQWLDAVKPTTVGAITALLSSAHTGMFSDWNVVLASSQVYDRNYFRGEVAHTTFDTGGENPCAFFVNGVPTTDASPLGQGMLVTSDLPRAITGEMLRMGNDMATTQVRGWNGCIAELVVFPTTLGSDDRRKLTRAVGAHPSGNSVTPDR